MYKWVQKSGRVGTVEQARRATAHDGGLNRGEVFLITMHCVLLYTPAPRISKQHANNGC